MTKEPPLNTKALSIEQLADFLTRAGGSDVSTSDIEDDLRAGAPRNDDGTINLLHYAAWLMG